jgi:hypothetical protein
MSVFLQVRQLVSAVLLQPPPPSPPTPAEPPRQPAAYFELALRLLDEAGPSPPLGEGDAAAQLRPTLRHLADFAGALPADVHAAAPLPIPRLPPPLPAAPIPLTPARLLVTDADALRAALVGGAFPPMCTEAHAPPLSSPLRSDEAARAAAGVAGGSAGAQSQSGVDRYGPPLNSAGVSDATRSWLDGVPPALRTAAALLRRLGPGRQGGAAAAAQGVAVLLGRPGGDDDASSDGGGWSVAVRLIVAAAAFDSYAPWATPPSAKAARELLSALAACLPAGSHGGSGSSDDASALVDAHAPELLRWCEDATAHGRWKEPPHAAARYVAAWVLCRLPSTPAWTAAAPPAHLPAAALAVAFRLCDDWEATPVWLGASAVYRVLTAGGDSDSDSDGGGAGVGVARRHEGLLSRCLERAAHCSHPTVAGLVHVCRLLLTGRVTAGPSPALARSPAWAAMSGAAATATDYAAYLALLRRGAAGAGSDEPPLLLDGPYDSLLRDVLRAAALSTVAELQAARLTYGVAPLVLAMGGRVVDSDGDDGSASDAATHTAATASTWLQPHAATLVPALLPLVADTGDARVAAAALYALRCVVQAAPGVFVLPHGTQAVQRLLNRTADPVLAPSAVVVVVPSAARRAVGRAAGGKDGSDDGCGDNSSSDVFLHAAAADAVDACVAAVAQAFAQSAAGLYAMTPDDTQPQRGGGAAGRLPPGCALVRTHALALVAQLLPLSGGYIRGALRRLHLETAQMLVATSAPAAPAPSQGGEGSVRDHHRRLDTGVTALAAAVESLLLPPPPATAAAAPGTATAGGGGTGGRSNST